MSSTFKKCLVVLTVALLGGLLFACSTMSHKPADTLPKFAGEVNDLPAEPTSVSFIALGDIVAHDYLVFQGRTAPNEYNFDHIFAPMKEVVESYDIAAITQETPFVEDDADVSGYPTFGTPTEMGDAIVASGFDVVVGATNHSMDKGLYGINTTNAYWNGHPEVLHLGMHDDPADANAVSIIEKNGIKIGFCDCTYGLNGFTLPEGSEYTVDLLADLDAICDNVRAAEDKCDFTVAFVHMGEEYATVPSEEQREVAARLIDAGADVVLGSHVHVVQPAEEMVTEAGNRGLVYYSLGNHVSNQIEPTNMLGGCAEFTIEKTPNGEGGHTETHITDWHFVPVVCHWNSSTCTEYFLEDYTDELASANSVGVGSVANLWNMWENITGLGHER